MIERGLHCPLLLPDAAMRLRAAAKVVNGPGPRTKAEFDGAEAELAYFWDVLLNSGIEVSVSGTDVQVKFKCKSY